MLNKIPLSKEEVLIEIDLNYRDFHPKFRKANYSLFESRIRKNNGTILERKEEGISKSTIVRCKLQNLSRIEKEVKIFSPVVRFNVLH